MRFGRRHGAKGAIQSGKSFLSSEPYTGKAWAEIPEGDEWDVIAAVQAAKTAFDESWWKREPRRRAAVLQRLAELLTENIELSPCCRIYRGHMNRNY